MEIRKSGTSAQSSNHERDLSLELWNGRNVRVNRRSSPCAGHIHLNACHCEGGFATAAIQLETSMLHEGNGGMFLKWQRVGFHDVYSALLEAGSEL